MPRSESRSARNASVGTIDTVERARAARRVFVGPRPGQPAQGGARRPSSCPRSSRCVIVTGDTTSALFGAFGSFSALVFADFGGTLRGRFRAYCAARDRRRVLVALGTACADTIWPAVIVTLVVDFDVVLVRRRSAATSRAGSTATTLAFVLAVMTPGVEADLWRASWGGSSGWAWPASPRVLLWPVHQRDRVRTAAVDRLAPRWPPPWRSRLRNDDSMPHGPRRRSWPTAPVWCTDRRAASRVSVRSWRW